MIVCLCSGTTDRQIEAAIAGGARCMSALQSASGAGAGCGGCLPSLRDMLRRSGAPEEALWCHAHATEEERGVAIA